MKTKSLEVLEKSQLPPEQARAILQVMEAEFATDELATKADLERELVRFATKADLEHELVRFATKADLARELERFATKTELARELECFPTKADLARELERFATKADLEKFATKADLAELKAELMKWTFVFWVGQMAAVLAIIKYLK